MMMLWKIKWFEGFCAVAGIVALLTVGSCIGEEERKRAKNQARNSWIAGHSSSQDRVSTGGSGDEGKSMNVCNINGEDCTVPDGTEGHDHVDSARIKKNRTSGSTQSNNVGEVRSAEGDFVGDDAIFVGRELAQILDVANNTVTGKIALSGNASRVAVSPDSNLAVVSIREFTEAPDGIDILDLAAVRRTGTIQLPADCEPIGLSFVPGTTDIWVACNGQNVLVRYPVADGSAAQETGRIGDCPKPRDVAFTADGNRGLFTCTDTVRVFDVMSDSVSFTFSGFGTALSLAVGSDGMRAYVGNARDNTGYLTVLDLESYQEINSTEANRFPGEVFLSTAEDKVYVLGNGDLNIANPDGIVERVTKLELFASTGVAIPIPITPTTN
jgi:hypothetical protein